ncbi:leucine-rich repeat protein [Skeletonema marinoi]|uniref:Leucine-rich repeat protein n=1 Tax=Skeletonema marinoi TaxID=267567 RepID=A0AAD8XW45_9STRA|nr:leucine-rich repeat protein [Skeletonema marinoi]
MESRDIAYYEAHEQDIRLEDITSDAINAKILHKLRYDDWNNGVNVVNLTFAGGDVTKFVIREGDDCGWLGYFIGKSQKLEIMFFDYFPQERERIDALMVGLCCNQSIQRIQVDRDIGEVGFRGLGNFLGNNQSVKHMNFYSFDIGSECAQNIASMFGQCQYTSLKHIEICENNLHDEEFAQIAAALAVQPQIEELVLCDNIIGRLGCIALGSTLKSWRAPSLKKLYISIRDIDDECIQVMAAGMINCSSLSELNLSGRYLTGEVGLRSFADVFQSESCCMEKLCLSEMSIGFDGASALRLGFRDAAH